MMQRQEERFVECRGEHGTLADAINEVKRAAQENSDVQFHKVHIFVGAENRDLTGKVISRLYVSHMEGVVR